MRAVVLSELGDPEVLRIEERADPKPGPRDAIVRLEAAALNHRDIWIRRGRYAGIALPVVLGSDGAGTVVDVGSDVDPGWRGREVVIDPSFNWGDDPRAQGPAFNILGLPTDGTYAELVRVPAENLHPKPQRLSFEEAAAVPLASVTAYRALVTRGALQQGETVLVTGIGGGVACAALTMAVRFGAAVYVTSGSDAKLAAAKTHGARGGVNHESSDWAKQLLNMIGHRPHVVIDGAGGATFNAALDVARPGGRVVSYGATAGPAEIEVRRIFWKQLDVLGSTMGTRQEFEAMLQLYTDGLRPVVDSVVPLSKAALAHRRMEEGLQFGKIVLRIAAPDSG
jgi:NADPH:quinone reductase-like Zn-dependent oxidoreductase